MASFEALLFDLDGTLLDTAKDLVQSGHAVREAMALAPLSDARVLSFVGKGAERFVHRLLTDDLDGDDPTYDGDQTDCTEIHRADLRIADFA